MKISKKHIGEWVKIKGVILLQSNPRDLTFGDMSGAPFILFGIRKDKLILQFRGVLFEVDAKLCVITKRP